MRTVVTDRVEWSVGLSVCRDREPFRNGLSDGEAVWDVDSDVPWEPCIALGPDPRAKGNFEGQRGGPL